MTERASVETHEKERHESAEHEARTEKVKALRVKGLKPWASKHDVTLSCQQVLEGGEGIVGSLAGRIMTIRGHGKASFCHLQDGSGRLQLYIKEDVVGEQVYAFFKEFVDSGDLISSMSILKSLPRGNLCLVINFNMSFRNFSAPSPLLPIIIPGLAVFMISLNDFSFLSISMEPT